jgi:hypothetical protein
MLQIAMHEQLESSWEEVVMAWTEKYFGILLKELREKQIVSVKLSSNRAKIQRKYLPNTSLEYKYYFSGDHQLSCFYLKHHNIAFFLFRTQRFGDWIASLFPGKTYSVGSRDMEYL